MRHAECSRFYIKNVDYFESTVHGLDGQRPALTLRRKKLHISDRRQGHLCSGVAYNGATYTVVAVGDKAFHSCTSLASVELPATITAIGANAFGRDYNLKSVNIPDGVTTIGESAFEGDRNLTSVSLGSRLSSIGENAFNGCSGLTSITVDEDNPVYDSREGCNTLIETASGRLLMGCNTLAIMPFSAVA